MNVALAGVTVIVSVLMLCHSVAMAAEGAPGGPASTQDSCHYGATNRMSQVSNSAIREASALVASQRWPGTYWTLNDAHNAPMIYAFNEQGQPQGAFQVGNAGNVDWEAMQMGPDGSGGYALYIGDIGDNNLRRREGVIYRVPEPEPAPAGEQGIVGTTAPATAFRFVFPFRAQNVEAMLVHPNTGEIVLVTKAQTGISLVYRFPLPADGQDPVILDLLDAVDLRLFDPRGGLITDSTVSPDGRHVTLRTYTSILVYNVQESAPLGSIWDQTPRVYQISDGAKGEGITYRFASDDLISIGEGPTTFLFQTSWQCS